MKKIAMCAAAALLMQAGARSALVSYSVEGEGPLFIGDKTDVRARSGIGYLDPNNPGAWHGPDAVIFNPVAKTTIGDLGTRSASGTMTINTIDWWMNGEKPTTSLNADDYTDTISRDFTLYLGGNGLPPQEVTQTLTLNVVAKKCSNGSETQTLTISGGGSMTFTWNDSQGTHELNIKVKDPIVLSGSTGVNANSASLVHGAVTATWDYELIPVPEASTIWAGALLLLPFGLSAFRSLRRVRA